MAETKTPILETKKLGITFGGLKASKQNTRSNDSDCGA